MLYRFYFAYNLFIFSGESVALFGEYSGRLRHRIMERGFESGRGVKQKKGDTAMNTTTDMGENATHTAVNTKDKLDFSASLYLETKDNTIGHVPFATLLKGESSRKQVNIRTFIALADNEADVVISKESGQMTINGGHRMRIMKRICGMVPVWLSFHDILDYHPKRSQKDDLDSSELLALPNYHTLLAKKINDLERRMLAGKLVLMDDDVKPLKKVDDSVNTDIDSKMKRCLMKLQVFRASTNLSDNKL
ncbi:hypothetical protein Tco_0393226 [Tanacetum coccineum]